MASNKNIDNLLQELENIALEVNALATDGCKEIRGLGENYHLKSLEKLRDCLRYTKNSIQRQYEDEKRIYNQRNISSSNTIHEQPNFNAFTSKNNSLNTNKNTTKKGTNKKISKKGKKK